ncbi:MAG TPA: hypothetical protein VGG75_28670 [Trebonia sp.]|jgi:hypothetical protein
MDLSPGQQRVLFVVIVVVLAGFGIYLITTHKSGGSSASPGPSASSSSAATPPADIPAGDTVPSSGIVSTAPPEGTTTESGQANIYNWLPFSQADLTEASKTTLAFAADYGTWSYTESAAAYVKKMNSLVTAQLASTLQSSFSTPQVAAQRSSQKQVSQGSGGIASIRSFTSGSESITFVVNIAQKMTSTQGAQTTTTQFAITCVPGPGTWEVNDIEYASAGNS